jgi:hypothetical protein
VGLGSIANKAANAVGLGGGGKKKPRSKPNAAGIGTPRTPSGRPWDLKTVEEFLAVLEENQLSLETMDPAKILASPLFSGPTGYRISPQLWPKIQEAMSARQQTVLSTEAIKTGAIPDPTATADDGGGGGGLYQSGTTPVPSPVLEVMQMQAQRREASRAAAQNQLGALLTAVPKMAPQGASYFPGMEEGGIADIMMGILSGKGVEASKSLIPQSSRQPGIRPIPQSLFDAIGAPEPGMESEFGSASSIARMILGQMLQLPQYSQMSRTSGSSSSGGGEVDIDSALASILGGA